VLFNSAQFVLVFLPVALIGFFAIAVAHPFLAEAWIVGASLLFYGWDDPLRLLPLILCSVACNYIVGLRLGRRRERWLLIVGVSGNLALLGYFKYAGFLTSTLVSLGFPMAVVSPELPIGISFFTFTQIAFLVDSCRGVAHEYRPLHYGLFVTFFPHLVAGPILHHKEIMPQFEKSQVYRINSTSVAAGLTWFAAGLAKKVLLADVVAPYSDAVFKNVENAHSVSFGDAWFGALSYAVQIYFDFSGYSDMAIGLALMIGISFPLNFFSPYRSRSLIEFWRRWHMTLSRFLRDYLYVPLGGNRKGPVRRYLNLLVTMGLGGLWHGASWNFVLWGAIHGLALAANHLWSSWAPRRNLHCADTLGQAMTLFVVLIAWIPFRASSLTDVAVHWRSMLSFSGGSMTVPATGWVLVAAMWAIALFAPNTAQLLIRRDEGLVPGRLPFGFNRTAWAAGVGAGLGIALANSFLQPSAFLYFRF
jgi:alginate O-acetyltransferase complex protein AlgI